MAWRYYLEHHYLVCRVPTSSSHALIGGYGGAAIAAYGVRRDLKAEGWIKTVIFIVASPLIGMVLGMTLMVAVHWIFRRATPRNVDRVFRKGQLFSAAAYSLGHGGNDAQKTIGIITAVLASGGILTFGAGGKLPDIPLWVVLSAHGAIALGTLSRDWRICSYYGLEDRRRYGSLCSNACRNSRFHYSHDYWRNRGRGSNKTIFRSQHGESLGYRVGMGINGKITSPQRKSR